MNHLPSDGSVLRVVLVCLLILLTACEPPATPSFSLEVARVGLYGGAFSDDSRFLAIGSIYDGGSLWRLSDRERLFNWNHQSGQLSSIVALDFSPDGKWAMSADHHTMVLWDLSTGEGVRFWTAPGEIMSLALGRNGNFALLGLENNSAVIFDVKRGGIKRQLFHTDQVRSVDLSEDGRFALTGSEDQTAVLWDLASGKALHTFQHSDGVQLVSLSPDGSKAISVAKYDHASVWDTGNGQLLGDIDINSEKLRRGMRFTAVKFNTDGSEILTGLPDRLVQLWDGNSFQELTRWQIPKRKAWKPTSATVLAVAFAADGTYWALSSNGFSHQLSR